MKQLLALAAILLVVGIAGFLYRNAMERPGIVPSPAACTADARLCPDGTAVGRQGPSCEFAACPPPNVEVPSLGLEFVVPEGYVADERAYGAEPTLVAAFVKPSLAGDPPHSIVIRRFPIPEGQTAEEVILANTRYQPADMQAEDLSRFEPAIMNGKTFQRTVIERFEAMVVSAYYLVRGNDVLRFEVTEHDVAGWTEPALAIEKLPEHAAFLQMLSSLQAAP